MQSRSWYRCFSLGVALWTCGVAGAGERWPVVPVPEWISASWVAEEVVENGIPMTIRQISSRRPMTEVKRYFQELWRSDAGPEPAVNEFAGWLIVGVQRGDLYLTAQLRESTAGGTAGLLAVSRLPAVWRVGVALEAPGDMDHPPSSVVVSRTDSNRQNERATTWVLTTDASVQFCGRYYRSRLAAGSWHLRRDSGISGFGTRIMDFVRNTETMTVTISRIAAETVVVVHHVVRQ